MPLKKTLLFAFVIFSFFDVAVAQNTVDNTLLVQLSKGINARDIIDKIIRNNEIEGRVTSKKICGDPLNIWKLDFDKRNNNLTGIIGYLSRVEGVEKAQFEHKLDFRGIPDDVLFPQQWSLNNTGQSGGKVDADIDADLAWDKTTGGVTSSGDTIVICVIDTGIDSDHEDLVDNLWINRNEIEDNGIDDDNNGYIDDYRGWNPVLGTDDIEGGSHGTSVAGIIGAKGNNHKGISGINWDVKLMIIPFSGKESEIIEAYFYVYTMRKLYNETNGEKGAFIVATNNSFGLDDRKAEDFPIWCSMYDLMGSVGVISVGATANRNTNVDIHGDMPSTCPSDFLISVTNMNDSNKKDNGAGFGRKNIDLGAYGEHTYSTKLNNGYGNFGGTSAATPHVTGVLGLLYSGGDKLGEYSKTYPVQVGLAARDAILKGVVHNVNLENITATEGVLNANNSLEELGKYDDTCATPLLIGIDTIGGDMFIVKWDDYDETAKYKIKFHGSNEGWRVMDDAKSPFTISGLDACSDYYFAIKQDCDGGKYGYTYHVKTDGCCIAPTLKSVDITGTKLHLEWDDLLAAKEYRIKYKFWSHPVWKVINTNESDIDLDIDADCGKYVVSLETVCADSVSEPSENILLGEECFECKTNDYCYDNINNGDEWIESFSIDDFSNISGADYDGKGVFRDSKSIKLISGQEYTVKMKIGYQSIHYNDFVYMWVDLNSDSLFSSNELVATDTTRESEYIEFSFIMPEVQTAGETNLRVLLVAESKNDPCDIGTDDYGEYEDYCVVLAKEAGCDVSKITIDTLEVGSGFVQLKWDNPEYLSDFYIQIKKAEDSLSEAMRKFISDTTVTFTGLDTCTEYNIYFTPYCSDIEKGETEILNVKTDCNVLVKDPRINGVKVYPNPVNGYLYVEGLEAGAKTYLEIYDLYGRIVLSKVFSGQNFVKLDVRRLISSGLYLIKLRQGSSIFSNKMIKL